MYKVLFNADWSFAPQSYEFMSAPSVKFEKVTLPHDALIHQYRDKTMLGGVHMAYFMPGSFEYKKAFAFDPSWEGKQVQLRFDGVYCAAKVYVNFMEVADHAYGYTPFTVDLTQYLKKDGENLIRVICRSYRDSRWYSGAGIYRNVYLMVSDPVHLVDGKTSCVTKGMLGNLAMLELSAELKNDTTTMKSAKVRFNIYDPADQLVATTVRKISMFAGDSVSVKQRMEIENPELWCLENPVLYHMEAVVTDCEEAEVIDKDQCRFGIRTLTLSKKYGLQMNGESVKLKGACIHHDNGVVGACEYKEAAVRRLKLMKSAGINAIRMSHHPASQEILEACDELGMLVMNEAFDTWSVNKNPHDNALYFEHNWEETVEKLVETSMNHPSVVLYSLGNEITECANAAGALRACMLNKKFKELDPTRFTTLCLNVLLCMMDERPMSPEDEPHTGDVNQEMSDNQDFFKTLIVDPEIAKKVEEAMGYVDIVGYNYGDSRYLLDLVDYPDRIIVGSETFPRDLAANWKMVEDHAHILGDFDWTGWDYLGEVAIGMIKYGEPESDDVLYKTAWVGDFDINGNRRAQSYYRETAWGDSTHPWILVQDPKYYGKPCEASPWTFFDGVASWDFPGDEGKSVSVQVYADADEVELLVNGESVAKAVCTEYVAKLDVTYAAGTITAIAYKNGEKVSEWSMESGKGSTSLSHGWEDPEAEIAYYSITNLYENGVVDMKTPVKVGITVEDGELLGFGSASPSSTENYFDTECKLFEGRALAIIRKRPETKVTIEVK